MYGCETWSLTLREEHRLRLFENRALRRIFGPKRDEVTGDWRKLHNEELHNLYSSPNIIYLLTYGAEPFLRSHQLCSHSRTSQHFKEAEGSSPCSLS
jgi:hypothetical protein